MKQRMFFSIFFLLVFCLPSNDVLAASKVPMPKERPAKQWLAALKQDALAMGVNSKTLDLILPRIVIEPKVIELDRSQPYKTKTFAEYKQNIIPKSRVDQARREYSDNKNLLEKIARTYKVQPRFIVALWGIESNFGNNMGNFNIIDALATLTIEGRRGEFFRKELLNALKIIDNGHINYYEMNGSWAGAMGQTQFMPSSFVELAVDYDGDGKKDIWGTKADVFASIANYLAKRGWDNTLTWGRAVLLPDNFNRKIMGIETKKPLTEWAALGIRNIDNNALPNREGLYASIITPEDDGDEFFLIYPNYATILKWNRSLYFATAVGLFSDSIKTN